MPRKEEDQEFVRAPPNSYVRVSKHTKDKLAYMVIVEQNKVSSAAKILKINDSTAKMTIRAFKLLPKEQQQKILLNGSIRKQKKGKINANRKKMQQKLCNTIRQNQFIQSNDQNKDNSKAIKVQVQSKLEQEKPNQSFEKQELVNQSPYYYFFIPFYCNYPFLNDFMQK